MTTSAPQWPGQEGIHERREKDRHPRGRQAPVQPSPVQPSPVRELPGRATRAGPPPAQERQPASYRPTPLRAAPDTTLRRLRPLPGPSGGAPMAPPVAPQGIPPEALSAARPIAASVAQPEVPSEASPPAPPAAPSRRQTERRSVGRRGPFVVVRDPKERELRVARRRARANLPSPAAVTRDIALALLEVEADAAARPSWNGS